MSERELRGTIVHNEKRLMLEYFLASCRESIPKSYGQSVPAGGGFVLCVVFVFFPFILDIKFVGRTSRGHTGGTSHRISHPPSFCGACLNFSREKDSAILSSTAKLNFVYQRFNRSPLVGHFFLFFFSEEKAQLPRFELTSQRVRKLRGYQLGYRGDRLVEIKTTQRPE